VKESTPQIQGDEATKIKKLKAQEKKPRHNRWLIPLLLVILLVIDPAVVIKLIAGLVATVLLGLLSILLIVTDSYYQV
jgi:hypothetical protein